jgi:hypothetical protein
VRADALAKALSRENARLEANALDVVVKYAPRGRVTLRGVALDQFPLPPGLRVLETVALGEDFRERLGKLQHFVGPPDGQPWSTGLHLFPSFSFAASNRAVARIDVDTQVTVPVSLPAWAVGFLAAQAVSPHSLHISDNLLRFTWASGLELTSTMMSDTVPGNAVAMVDGLVADPDMPPVPPGLADTVARAAEHGATSIVLGGGVARFEHDAMTFEEEVDLSCDPRAWSVPYLAEALAFATHLDLTGSHGLWQAESMRGIFAGLT